MSAVQVISVSGWEQGKTGSDGFGWNRLVSLTFKWWGGVLLICFSSVLPAKSLSVRPHRTSSFLRNHCPGWRRGH